MKIFLAILLVTAVASQSTGKFASKGARIAVADIRGAQPASRIRGKLYFEQASPSSPVKIRGEVEGLPSGYHGMHIHEGGDIDQQCMNVGLHFNPLGNRHGGPTDPVRHAGDLGNIVAKVRAAAQSDTHAQFSLINDKISLFHGPMNVLNRALVIHMRPDDLGRGANKESLVTGNAGGHLACAVIQLADEAAIESGRGKAYSWAREFLGKEEESAFPRRSIISDMESEKWEKKGRKSFWDEEEGPIARESLVGGEVPSNLELEGVDNPDFTEANVPTETSPVPTSTIWKAGNLYEYDYEGSISTGMPSISPQLSGGIIKARVCVEPKDESTLVVAVTRTKAKLFNEPVLEKWQDADPGQEIRVVDKEHIEKPILVKIIDGKVESVGISREEPLWTVNFKRAIVAQLQLQLDENSAVITEPEAKEFYKTNAVYAVMEGCTSGECQTYYQLTRVPEAEVEANPELVPLPEICSSGNVYEIVKNRDFDKCKLLPVFNYISLRGLKCNMAELGTCENMISRVDLSRMIGCVANDGSFVVQKIVTTDKLIHKPFGYETEPLEGISMQRFSLRAIRSSGSAGVATKLPGDLEIYKTLVYAYDEELKVHGPYLKKPSLRDTETPIVQLPRKDAVIKEIDRLFNEVIRTLESDEYYVDPVGTFVPEKMNMMKAAMMYLNYDELKSLAARYIGPKFSTANQVFVDTLTYCGTNPAIMVLKDLIISNRINTELIVNSIALLPATVKTPTKDLLSDLIDFMQSNAIMQDRRLKIALALSISRLVDQACVNTTDAFTTFPEMVMGQFCTPYSDVVVNKLIPVLVEELNNADDEEEKIAMLAALGNLGHEAIIPAVLPYVSSCDPSTEEEYSWYERERRSVKDESPAAKKALRKKWLTFKRGKSKQEKQALRKLEKERDEEEEWGMSPLEAKLGAKDMKAKNKIAASKRKDEMTIRAWELQEKRLEDMEKAQEKQLKHKSKIAKKAKSGHGWASRGPAEAEEDEEEEEEEAGFMSDQAWSRTMGADLESVGIEEEYEEEEEDQALCNIVRMKAVYALSKLAKEKNEAVLPILMPISSNKDEDTEVRLAALSLLFVHNLPAAFWARVAASTWFEPNDHVATFIYTTLANLAKNKDPKNRDAAKKAEAVIAMVKPNRWAPHISTAFINGELQERTRLGYNLKSFSFGGHESFLPSNHYTNFILRLGPWAANILEVSVNGVHMEKFIDQWIGAPTRRWKASGVYGGTASKVLAHPELSKIHQELKIEARAKGSPEMFIYINHMDNYQRFFSIDRSNFNEILNRLVRPHGLRGPTGKYNLNYHNYFPIMDKMTRVPSAMGLAYGVFKHHKFVTNIKTSMSGSMDLGASSGVQGIIQSALAMKLHAKMTVETPFARAIPTCGVDITTRTTLPGKFKIEGDYKNGKVEAAWKFLGRRSRLGFYSVAPFITIRDVDDFTPSMLIKGTKPIALLDTLRQSTTSYGARATGLNFVYQERHDAKALNTPLAFSKEPLGTAALLFFPSTLRFCEHSLYLDLTKSDTKAVKLHLAISAKHQDQIKSFQKSRNIMEEGLFKGLLGKKIKSGRFLEEDPEEEWTQHKFSNLFEKLEQNPYGFTVDASVAFVTGQSSAESEWPSDSAKAIRFGTSLTSGFDQLGIRHRTHFMLEKEIEEDPDANFVMCVEGNINWPAVFAIKREKLLTKEVSTTAGLNIAFGNSCNDRKISIMTEFKNTDKAEYTRIPEVGLEQLRCLADELKGKGAGEECVNTERLANILNKVTVTIKHNEMPAALRNFTHKAENALRHWLGAHLSDNRVGVQNEKGQIKIEAIYHPIIGTMDIRTFKPESNTFFHNVEVTPIAEAVIPFHPTLTAYRAAFRGPGICVVDEDTVTTYDGVNYNVSLSSCDHVVTKDCSGRYKMAVLAREEANSKIVTVLLNKEKIELNPVSRQVRINGQVKSLGASEDVHRVIDDLNQIIATVRQTRDGFLEVSSPTHWIRVTAGPREVLVMGSAVHRGQLCGLCGSQSGDKTDDLTGPMKCSIPADLMDVAYQLNRPAGCQKSSLMAKEVSELRNIQRTCKTEEESYSALERISNKYETRLGVPFVEDWEMTGRSRFSYPDMEKWEHLFAANKFEGVWEMKSSADRNPFLQAKSLGCNLVRNKVSTQGALKCFSTVPVTKCAAGCKPVSVMTKKVGFHCVAKTSLAEHLIQEAWRRPLDELVNKEISMVADVKVPTACVPAGVSSFL